MATKKKNAPAPATFDVGPAQRTRQVEEQLTVNLVGVHYQVFIPKTASALELARTVRNYESKKKGDKRTQGARTDEALVMMGALDRWIDSAFTEDDAEDIRTRLKDPREELDYDHISELMEKVTTYSTEEETGNPTT